MRARYKWLVSMIHRFNFWYNVLSGQPRDCDDSALCGWQMQWYRDRPLVDKFRRSIVVGAKKTPSTAQGAGGEW